MKLIQIHPEDTVLVALTDIAAGETVVEGDITLTAVDPIPRGHKVAYLPMKEGDQVIKYGSPIGHATKDITVGQHVHTHNVFTNLTEDAPYYYEHKEFAMPEAPDRTFDGYLRADGSAGIRNELWVIPTVGCVGDIAERLAKDNQDLVKGSVDGLYAFNHPFGCSQMDQDLLTTARILTGLTKHPNAGGVLVLSLGCEELTEDLFRKTLGDFDASRVRFLNCQNVADEIAEGRRLLEELAEQAYTFKREPLPLSKLVVGMKCGGSDGLSGITANPTVGRFSDLVTAAGGSTILTEVPEMFGAEQELFNRCVSEEVFKDAVNMVTAYKKYFTDHGKVVYENPSPGNKAGGITSLEDKSLGCVQKGGRAQITEVIAHGSRITKPGLHMMDGPGNDLISSTGLTCAGAVLILFTTGRGTPFSVPAPTLKIASNSALAEKKSNWIDFNAGTAAEGESLDSTGARLLDLVIEVASGRLTKAEECGYRSIAIFKDGVIL